METDKLSFRESFESVSLDFLKDEPFKTWDEILKASLSDHRYKHVVRVTGTAVLLARYYGEDEAKAARAAFLHDVAKKNEKRYFKTLLEGGHVREEDWMPSPYLHAYLGGLVAKYILGVEDGDIIRAIQSHTLGSDHMSRLDKIIFLADLIEPGRDFPDLPDIQKAALSSLNEGVVKAFNNTIFYLINKGQTINPQTILARNAIIEEMKAEKKGKEFAQQESSGSR